jgi:GntR family transcriptional regulator
VSAPLRVDLASPVPPFEQIRAGIAVLVHEGVLARGARLPTVRSLAADLGVAAGTVARAYRELEAAGVIEGQGSRGTIVRSDAVSGDGGPPRGHRGTVPDGPDQHQSGSRRRPGALSPPVAGAAPPDVTAAVARARTAGIPVEALTVLVRDAYADVSPPPTGRTGAGRAAVGPE